MKHLIVIIILVCSGHLLFAQERSFYSLSAITNEGKEFSFEQLKGKKVMIVNTASRCSLSPQFRNLQRLYTKFERHDFIVLAFPANDFANREPGNDEEIKTAVDRRFGITFPMMQKISVKGENIHPVYQWLTQKSLNGVKDSDIKWNFQKYLIDENGKIHEVLEPLKKPDGKDVVRWIRL